MPPRGGKLVYTSAPTPRVHLRASKIPHTPPERTDQAGGRDFDRPEQRRAIATRYDKYATTYLSGVMLACTFIHHCVRKSRTRPEPGCAGA